MHGMNYLAKGVNYPEKREETLRLWPRGPFSNSGNDFPKMWSVREEKAALEERGWDNEVSGCGGGVRLCMYMCLVSPFPHSRSLLIRSRVEMQNTIMAPSERTNATFMMDECGI